MERQKIYFPNLNGLRFIAASLVIIHHIEQFKAFYNIENYWGKVPFIMIVGKLGVILFFVLSGFLITYLLLTEEFVFKKISIGKFYMRRILRIWPLYFFIIFLSLFILPHIGLFTIPGYEKNIVYSNFYIKLFLYAVFFPNLVLMLFGIVPYASHTWSIGTEEQFYLLWPVLLKYFKKYKVILMLFIIFLYPIVERILASPCSDILPYKKIFKAFWTTFNIDCMAIGGIYAVLFFQKNKLIRVVQNNLIFNFTLLLVIVLILIGFKPTYLHYEFYSVLFGIIILNFATNRTIKISLENNAFNYLGNISYGLYMYHPIGIVLSIVLCIMFGITTNWLIYPLSFIFTILFAGISYKYFESSFLKYKDKFAKVFSGSQKD